MERTTFPITSLNHKWPSGRHSGPSVNWNPPPTFSICASLSTIESNAGSSRTMFPTPCISAPGAGAGAWEQPTSRTATARTSRAFIFFIWVKRPFRFHAGIHFIPGATGIVSASAPRVKTILHKPTQVRLPAPLSNLLQQPPHGSLLQFEMSRNPHGMIRMPDGGEHNPPLVVRIRPTCDRLPAMILVFQPVQVLRLQNHVL